MKVKEVPSPWITRWGNRLDAGPYLSGAVDARMLMENPRFRSSKLSSVTTDIYHAGRESRRWVSEEKYGVPFLSSSDILRADLSDLPLLSKGQVGANPSFVVRRNWTLITRSGTIGRMAYVRPDMDGMACSEHAMRVVPDEGKIAPGYLFAFLRSRFGVPMVIGGTYGSIIQSIEPDHIAGLLVPRLGDGLELKAHSLVNEAASLLTAYQRGVLESTKAFFDSVGLRDITSPEWHIRGPDVGFETRFPRVDSFRALNFNPRFEQLCAAIKERDWLALGEVCEPGTLQRGGRYKRIDASPEFAHRLVGQKQLFWLQPEGRWIARSALGPDVFVPAGTCLVAAQGTLGENELFCRAEFAWGPWLEFAYSEHILRVVANEDVMRRGCLYAFLRSETAFRMFRTISVGTKLQDHHYLFRAQLPIPIPGREAQESIHRKIVEAYEARHRAVALMETAVALVEATIAEAG